MEPMTCRAARPLLSRYADGELPSPEGKELREHLIGCPRCRLVVSEIASVRRSFEDPAGDARLAPAGFADRVAALAVAGGVPRDADASVATFARRIAAAAAAVALLAGGGILVRSGVFDRGPSSLQAQEEDPFVRKIRDRFDAARSAPTPHPGTRAGGAAVEPR